MKHEIQKYASHEKNFNEFENAQNNLKYSLEIKT